MRNKQHMDIEQQILNTICNALPTNQRVKDKAMYLYGVAGSDLRKEVY